MSDAGWPEPEVDFTSFVRANTAALLRTAYLLTGSSGAAEELVQETLVRLYPQWHRVEAADVPLAYVRRSVTNTFLNQRRGGAARHEVVTDLVPDRPVARSAADELADRDHVWRLLQTLAGRQRAALVLRYYDGLDDDEIAAALGCRPGTVRSLLSRGLAALRADLGRPDLHPGRTS
ncbi:MAG: SigE family RNA polymerase sigma factor [Jatrophihabitans sp.]|uniref:SigE family RNA polymerase sigma factor n=1 Tax=Jatrophihabitans sp. TaxID=1932789 RepID=UPI003F8113E6